MSKEQRQQELNRRTLSFKKSLQYLSLHVKGFRLGTTAQEVIDFFLGQSGQEVKGVKITNTGAALVSFADREAARVAKERINGALIYIQNSPGSLSRPLSSGSYRNGGYQNNYGIQRQWSGGYNSNY